MMESDSLSPFQPPKKDGNVLAAPMNLHGDLIDLNTPKDDHQKFVQTDVCRPKVLPTNIKVEGAPGGDSAKIENEKSEISNSASADNMSNSLYVSHTESGYLTDSVTSGGSRDRNPSIGSEDKTPCHEVNQTSSSETTPCVDNLMSFAGGGEQGRILQSASLQQLQNGAAKGSVGLGRSISNGEALARLDLNCDMKNNDIGNIFATNSVKQRPESLVLPRSVQKSVQNLRRSDSDSFKYSAAAKAYAANAESMKDYRKRSKSYGVPIPVPRLKEGVNITEEGLSKSLPQGQIMKGDGGLIEFIADDLAEKIRRSSPASKASDMGSSRSSLMSDSMTSMDSFASSTVATSMTSGMSMSYPQSPDFIPPIDPMALLEIETQARLVADSVDLMMGNLRNNLHKMSAISVGCEEAYRTSVDVTCDSVDSSIKAMYALMAKCEELSATMKPVYALADQIKEIKRLLDRFESQLTDKP